MLTLPDADWRYRDGLDRLLDRLGAADGATRLVGGAVRDALLGLPVSDIDCATRLQPEEALLRIKAAGFNAVPTGLAHGTVTAILPSGPVEVTTLRRDVSTDGRHAEVAFTDDWREDAARRDFTINALSADPASGELFDYFGGLDDLAARRVRFIGDPLRRIAEDHLRILRFFRFHARFGGARPNAEGLAACAARANDLMALSRERIADELLKLLATSAPAATIRLMLDQGILAPILPEIAPDGVDRLARVVMAEERSGIEGDAIRRLAALLPDDPDASERIGARLRLSKLDQKRLRSAATRRDADLTAFALAYGRGVVGARDRLLLDDAVPDAASLAGWERPVMPVTGGALIQRGLKAGPVVAATLQAIEGAWVREGFPDAGRVAALTDAAVAQALSADQ